jgi:hypothetical protein
MLNNKYATTWTYYDRALPMNIARDSQLSLRNYNTCILFIPSEVTVEEGKIPYQIMNTVIYSVTTT